jgi:type IV secretion system protein VirD4
MLGTATEQRAMRNYAGHRLAPWLAHVMVSRQETARPLLTPGEVMQLPASDELIFVAGHAPVRARKLRYYQERTFRARILDTPKLNDGPYADLPPARPSDWNDQRRDPDPRLADIEGAAMEQAETGREQARLPAPEQERPVAEDSAPKDLLGVGEDEDDAATDQRAMDQARALSVTRTAYAIGSGSRQPDELERDIG